MILKNINMLRGLHRPPYPSLMKQQEKSLLALKYQIYRLTAYVFNETEKVMNEKSIEQKLVKAAKSRGGLCLKLVCPGFDGMPDRLVLLPNGHIGVVEVKAPGKKPRALQLARHRQLRNLGFQVFVLDNKEQIEEILIQIGGDAR